MDSTVRQFDITDAIPTPSYFLADFVRYFRGYTDAPLIFGLGIALLAVGQCLSGATVNLLPPYRHSLGLFLVGKSGQTRKTTSLHLFEKLGLPTIPFGSTEATIEYLAKTRKTGILMIDECSGILKACQRPSYLQGLTEFLNRVYDGSKLEHNTRRSGLIEATGHYVDVIMATTEEGFASSVTEEFLYNGFINRFVVLVGEGNPRPRSITAPKESDPSATLKDKLQKIRKSDIRFSHTEESSRRAFEASQGFGDLDSRLTSRLEEHILQISDIIALDRHLGERLDVSANESIEVAAIDVSAAMRFVSEATVHFTALLRLVSVPAGALKELYRFIDRLHQRGTKKFNKSQLLKSTRHRARETDEALRTATEAGYLRMKRLKRRGEQYQILENPLEARRTVELSNLSRTEQNASGQSSAGECRTQRCPNSEECGYEGVFLWTALFEEHLIKYHGRGQGEPDLRTVEAMPVSTSKRMVSS